MRRFWLPSVIGVTFALLLWQWPSDSTALTVFGLGKHLPRVTGSVTDRDGGHARTTAWVLARRLGGGAHTVPVSEQGSYTIEGLKPGRYLITAFDRLCEPVRHADTVLLVEDKEARIDFELTEPACGSVSGTVLTPARGLAVPGAEIRLVALEGVHTCRGITDAEGRYVIPDVPAGSYAVFAIADGWGCVPWSGDLDVPAAGTASGVDFRLPRNPHSFNLTGRVEAQGQPLDQVELCAFGSSLGATYVARTDSVGHYRLSADDISHLYIWARRYDRGGIWFGSSSGWTYSDLRSMTDRGIDLDLQSRPHGPWGIAGCIRMSGRPLQAGCVEVTDERGYICDIAPIWPGGYYRASHLIPGQYMLRLIVPDKAPLLLGDVTIESAHLVDRDYDAVQMVSW